MSADDTASPRDVVAGPVPPVPPTVELPDGLDRVTLLGIVGDARDAGGALVLEGHGSSGVAVLSLALHQRRLGLEIAHVTCLDARGGPDPISGAPLPDPAAPRHPTRVTLVAGRDDASRAWTERTAAAWRAAGWDVD